LGEVFEVGFCHGPKFLAALALGAPTQASALSL
jgi:hypothetical protein